METSPILTASPELVAKRIYEAGEKRKNVVYVKSVWRLIMYIIGVIPEFIIKRMRL